MRLLLLLIASPFFLDVSFAQTSAATRVSEMYFRPVSVVIDGARVQTCNGAGGAAMAGYVAFYCPGQGRFVFSGVNFPRAERVAEVRGSTVVVRADTLDFTLTSREPILRDAESGLLYFRYDPEDPGVTAGAAGVWAGDAVETLDR